jgi:hypothetical protein
MDLAYTISTEDAGKFIVHLDNINTTLNVFESVQFGPNSHEISQVIGFNPRAMSARLYIHSVDR